MTEKNHASLAIPARDPNEGPALPPRHVEWKRAKIALVIVLALLAIGAARTVVTDVLHSRSIASRTQQNAQQYVNVVLPTQTDGGGETILSGTLRGFVESPIYVRATGYLLHWYVDIGTCVKQG